MIYYTVSEVQKQLSSLLKKAMSEGQIQFKSADGQVFVIRPVRLAKVSPFEVRSISLPITKKDILESIRESRARF